MSRPRILRRRGATGPSPLRRTLAIARPHLAEHRWLLLGGLGAMLLVVALRVAEPWPVKLVIDAVSASLGADGGAIAGHPPATLELLLSCGLLVLGLVLLRALMQFVSTVAFALAGSRVATSIRSRLFAHLQRLSARYHARAPQGDTVQRLVGDIGRLQEVAVTAGLPLVGDLLTLVALAVVMAVLDPVLALVVLAASLGFLLLSRGGTGRITAAARRTRRGEGRIADLAAETLGAIRVVHAYGLEGARGETFERGNRRVLGQGVEAKRLAAALERGTDVIVGLAFAVVLVVGGLRVVDGAITPGDLVLFTTYLKLSLRPIRDLAKHTGRIARALASGERVADLLDEPAEIVDRPGALRLGRARGAVSLDGVRVRDGHGRPLLDGLSLAVEPGSRVCIVGPSGAGKSTLVGLLTRATDPESGVVRLDGLDVRDATLESLRANVAVVLQEAVLFRGTVRENIRLGRRGATDEEVEEAARRALAHDFIAALPEGYDTELGTRGETLSGGQRQRIAIARALLRDAPVVVLDEPTTGLDPRAAAAVSASIRSLTERRTTIAISHDPVALRGADRVLWLEDGRIVEDGRPEELLADPGSRVRGFLVGAGAGA
ncbi:ABC transporter ATP-binding protein [Agrococcus sp. SL85]|uniref:ABC transporter ATP-binding protein n=1 Tax=Agrococcus sp. SL85 TaxID=2995141 RepID=UPI00226CF515|nr:ABC transporter ATP-binding protein [Agrococcus sp. SL85]WAC65594.1 ABC transporter ATP-binding protein [Agrococcus sp. SL85]